MERDDVEGAKAAAEYFLELHAYIYATGDLQEWDAMSHPDCRFCSGASESVAELFAEGGYASGGEFIVEEMGASPPDAEYGHYRVGVTGTERPSTEYESDGNPISTLPGGSGTYHFAVVNDEGRWIVRGAAWEGGV